MKIHPLILFSLKEKKCHFHFIALLNINMPMAKKKITYVCLTVGLFVCFFGRQKNVFPFDVVKLRIVFS